MDRALAIKLHCLIAFICSVIPAPQREVYPATQIVCVGGWRQAAEQLQRLICLTSLQRGIYRREPVLRRLRTRK